MIRFPNPGSTVQNFIAVYTAAYNELNDRVINLDDIVAAVVGANLATSSGYIGQEAIARSTRPDRSRDPLYNQLKMYAEIFRSLGWLHPTEEKSLNFTFTLLGRQIVVSGRHWLPLFQESVIGIAYPSNILEIKGNYDLRPFAFILRSMRQLGNCLSRDEMILGPLSASSDRAAKDINAVVQSVQAVRKSSKHVESALEVLSAQRKIQINTLRNYTRWPIAVLRDTKWVEDSVLKFADGSKYNVFKLTAEGMAIADSIENSADIRLDQYNRLTTPEKRAISIHGHYSMLERAGFDLSPVNQLLQETRGDFEKALVNLGFKPNLRVLFSPFQTLSLGDINSIFPVNKTQVSPSSSSAQRITTKTIGRDSRDHLFVEPKFTTRGITDIPGESEETKRILQSLLQKHGSIDEATAQFATLHRQDTKERFYPLVTHLFQIIGYRSENSRAGVNYQRWDACVWIGETAIPIEIKSPTEELVLSTKSIRQALENKIISLSRGGIDKRPEVTSLIVGFDLPHVRSEMANLIDDIHKAYGLRIGVLSLLALAKLTMLAISKGKMISPEQLTELMGFLDV